MNFDGEHVDLVVATAIVDLLGADCLIGITDRVEGGILAGRRLISHNTDTLLYQHEGVVAAGSQTIDRQMQNLRSSGVSEDAIWQMFALTPGSFFGTASSASLKEGSFVDAAGQRSAFY
jgi:N-acetylglucosamine-6-phosphate deacetylase